MAVELIANAPPGLHPITRSCTASERARSAGFVKDLRNFTLHRRLPLLAHTVSFTKVNTPGQEMVSEVELSVAELLTWDGWKADARAFLKGAAPTLPLRAVIKKHGKLMRDLNSWLLQSVIEANDLDPVNDLIVEINATRFGVDRGAAAHLSTPEWEL